MAKRGYLARAYSISEYAYMRQCESEAGEAADESFEAVKKGIEYVLELAEADFTSVRLSPVEYRTIRQCKKWLHDFAEEGTV